MTWRVVRQYDEDGCPYHTLEDVFDNELRDPYIVRHQGPISGITIDDLRNEMRRMREAFDLPVMEYYQPGPVLREYLDKRGK